MAPVCSPTAIICVTIPGNTSLSFNGSVRDLPSSRDFLTCCKALSTTALPAVLAVMSSPSRMGTPLDINVPRVLVNRATAIFLINMPSTGSFRTMVSSTRRPCARYHCPETSGTGHVDEKDRRRPVYQDSWHVDIQRRAHP